MGYNSFVYDLFESFLCEDKIDPIVLLNFVQTMTMTAHLALTGYGLTSHKR